MPRDYKVYLEDILEAVSRIKNYLSGLDWPAASKDHKTFDAVVRNLEIIGEAVKNLPSEIKALEPGIEWRKIGAFRDILAYQYFGIDEAIIGEIIEHKLPALENVVRKALEK
jgi:uncharacterized protein with HEPN domain